MKFQAISIILFAAALVRNVESTGLRGSPDHKDTNELQQQRSLFDVNGMVCGEHSAKDGSIWCTFRVMPNIATTVDSCLKVSGSDLCLSADISMGSLSVPADPTNVVLPSPLSGHNSPPIPPLTQTTNTRINFNNINTGININNSNPKCPPQNQVPASGDTCSFSGKYFSCEYFSAVNEPRIQCRCNNDNFFYCRTIDPYN